MDYIGTVVSLDDRPERDAVIRKGDLLEEYVDDEDLDPLEREVMIRYDEKAVMEMPLVFGGEALGVLGVVESRRDRRFTDEEKQLLRLLAGPAATAIGNARLFRQQQEQARRLGTLLDASRTLAASVHLDEVLAGVARLAAEAAGATYATVYEYRPHHDALVYRAAHSPGRTPEGVRDDALGTVYALADCPGERVILGASEAVQEQHLGPRPARRPAPVHGDLAAEDVPQPAAARRRRPAGHPAAHDDRRRAAVHGARARAARGARGVRRSRDPQRAPVPRAGGGERAAARASRGQPPPDRDLRPARGGDARCRRAPRKLLAGGATAGVWLPEAGGLAGRDAAGRTAPRPPSSRRRRSPTAAP